MKRALALIATLLATSPHAETLRMAVTTSFYNSGLSNVLLPEIKADLNLDVELIIVGTGQALRLGEAGDVDAILVHARAAEDTFLANGFGTHRREIMYNDFIGAISFIFIPSSLNTSGLPEVFIICVGRGRSCSGCG